MDSIFLLNEGDRANCLQQIIHSFGCTYICLWSYLPQPSNCLLLLDGIYHEENNQAPSSSSSASISRRLFNQYTQSILIVDKNSHVPGLAFKNRLPYIQLNTIDLPRLVSTQPQLQFYQETRIKNVIFMGCKAGEIELGLSTDTQVNLEKEMRNLFPEDFSQQDLPRGLSQLANQNQASSSSSSLRSLSMDSHEGSSFQFMDNPEYSPFQFNMPNNPQIQKTLVEPPLQQTLRPILTQPRTSTTNNPFQEAIQALAKILNPQFPTLESVDAIMTKALLTVITSSYDKRQKAGGAFQSYRSTLSPTSRIKTTTRNQNMFKQSIKFFSRLNLARNQEQIQVNRPMSTRSYHVISERRRREKLNERFQALASLMPPGSKKDKTSVLGNAAKYLASLKVQVEELSRRNHMLLTQLHKKEANNQERRSGSPSERLQVRVIEMGESTLSESRIVDLIVNVRGECRMLDLVIRVLEFLKQVKNLHLLCIQAKTRMTEASSINCIILRLKIEGGEWDESAFQEAVRRVVDDMAH